MVDTYQSSKPAAQCKSAIKEFEFCSLRTTFRPIHGNSIGKIVESHQMKIWWLFYLEWCGDNTDHKLKLTI